ncbi:hypothetical protein ABH930_007103 [Kitasatospora sp. GAS204A]|nr:hypothetical protein [Kitasatospora sp. GAS204B]
MVRMYDQAGDCAAVLIWQVCDACRYGRIKAIYLWGGWQRQGYGRLLIERALREGPGYTWITTPQTPAGRGFFTTITAHNGTAFSEHDCGCEHLRKHQVVTPAPTLPRDRLPVLDPMDATARSCEHPQPSHEPSAPPGQSRPVPRSDVPPRPGS